MGPPETFRTIDDLKVMWKKQEEITGRPIRRKKLVDVCIPSYKEEGYIEYTLDKLMNQSLWKEELMNLVVGEYTDNPQYVKGQRSSYLQELCNKHRILHTFVPRKGVGFARNWTILNGSISDIIMNFDADSRFNRTDAVQLMINPILQRNGIEMTYCSTVLTSDKLIKSSGNTTLQELAYRWIQDAASIGERFIPIGRALGLAFTRHVFFKVNGFPLTNVAEDYTFHWRFATTFGIFARKFVEEVTVLSSDRRARAISEVGAMGALNYNKNYR